MRLGACTVDFSPPVISSGGELIGWPWSGVRPSFTFSKIFSSGTAWPIKAKLHVEHPWERGTKTYINGPGHMTKMAAKLIYDKNHKKISSLEPVDYFNETWCVASGTLSHHSLYKS